MYKRLLLGLLFLALVPFGTDAQVSISGSGNVKVVINDQTTGTVLNGLAKIISTGAIR